MSFLQFFLLILGAVGVVMVLSRKKTPENMTDMTMTEAAGLGCLVPLTFVVVGGIAAVVAFVVLYSTSKTTNDGNKAFFKAAFIGLGVGAVAMFWVIQKKFPKKWL
jgi:hypothetical protein